MDGHISVPCRGFHDVYLQVEALKHYRKTGKFPDGAVIVKAVRKIEQDLKTAGQAQWAGDIKIWFGMINNCKGRFEGSPHCPYVQWVAIVMPEGGEELSVLA